MRSSRISGVVMSDLEKPYTPAEFLELMSLRDLDAVYALAGKVMNDGFPLGFKLGRQWRFDRDRVRKFIRGELDPRVAEPSASQRELLKGTKSIIRPRR